MLDHKSSFESMRLVNVLGELGGSLLLASFCSILIWDSFAYPGESSRFATARLIGASLFLICFTIGIGRKYWALLRTEPCVRYGHITGKVIRGEGADRALIILINDHEFDVSLKMFNEVEIEDLILMYYWPKDNRLFHWIPVVECRCHKCNYNLRGTLPIGKPTCPECGVVLRLPETRP